MKNRKKNKEKWIEKVRYTLEIGGKSNKTFDNYKSHINRFLNYYDEDIEINKLSEDKIIDYFRKNYILLHRVLTKSHEGAHHHGYGFLCVAFFMEKYKKERMMVVINGEKLDIDGMLLLTYLEANNYPLERIAVEINEEIVPKSQYDTVVLNDGDTVEVVSFVGGGWFL